MTFRGEKWTSLRRVGPGGLGCCHPRLPQTCTCGSAYGSSNAGFATQQLLCARFAILGRYGDTCFQVQSLGRSAWPRAQHRTPPFGLPFPPPGPAGPVEVVPLSRTGESLRYSPRWPRTDLVSGIRLKSAFVAYCNRQCKLGFPVRPFAYLRIRSFRVPS